MNTNMLCWDILKGGELFTDHESVKFWLKVDTSKISVDERFKEDEADLLGMDMMQAQNDSWFQNPNIDDKDEKEKANAKGDENEKEMKKQGIDHDQKDFKGKQMTHKGCIIRHLLFNRNRNCRIEAREIVICNKESEKLVFMVDTGGGRYTWIDSINISKTWYQHVIKTKNDIKSTPSIFRLTIDPSKMSIDPTAYQESFKNQKIIIRK